jgi:hypothetical protein
MRSRASTAHNRACGFPRTRLSSTGIHLLKHRAGLTHFTTYSLSGKKTRTCSPSSCLRHYASAFGYSGNSVAIRLAPGRRSRIDARETFSPFRCPVRLLALFIARYSPQRAGTPRCVPLASTVSPRELCCDGRRMTPLETGIQPMQASPCGQDWRN